MDNPHLGMNFTKDKEWFTKVNIQGDFKENSFVFKLIHKFDLITFWIEDSNPFTIL